MRSAASITSPEAPNLSLWPASKSCINSSFKKNCGQKQNDYSRPPLSENIILTEKSSPHLRLIHHKYRHAAVAVDCRSASLSGPTVRRNAVIRPPVPGLDETPPRKSPATWSQAPTERVEPPACGGGAPEVEATPEAPVASSRGRLAGYRIKSSRQVCGQGTWLGSAWGRCRHRHCGKEPGKAMLTTRWQKTGTRTNFGCLLAWELLCRPHAS